MAKTKISRAIAACSMTFSLLSRVQKIYELGNSSRVVVVQQARGCRAEPNSREISSFENGPIGGAYFGRLGSPYSFS